MAVVLRYFCCRRCSSDFEKAELESMYTFCSELEFRLKNTEDKLTRSKSETEDAKLRCNTFSQAYETKIEEKDKMIKMLRTSLKNVQAPDIKNGLTTMSREITENQKQEQEYLKHRCESLEKMVESLRRENQKLGDEVVKLKKNLNKSKKSKKRCVFSSRQPASQKIPLLSQWQQAVNQGNKEELSRLLPVVEWNTREKALLWFVKFDNVDLVKLLLDNEVKTKSIIESIIWYAVEKGSEKVCQELVVRKADVNIVDRYGVDLITFCANSAADHNCRKRLLSILYRSETNRQKSWVNDDGEEIDLRTYCGDGEAEEDKADGQILIDWDNLSIEGISD